jgi:hypothetical protein
MLFLSPTMAHATMLLALFYSFDLVASRSYEHLLEHAQLDTISQNATLAVSSSSPSSWLVLQFKNPSEVLSILLLIGGDIVQKAIAQLVGRWTVTPAAFSFGWVSYAFMALSSAFGDGTLMPLPDVPCRVVNLKTGHYRQNESWVIGRLLRDLELKFDLPVGHRRPVIRILTTTDIGANPRGDKCWWSFLFFIPAQLLLAAGPLIARRRNWTILMVTAAGSLLATITSSLPQWRKEKFNCRTNSKETYVITRGNGHPHVFVIQNGAIYPSNPTDQSKKSGISVNLEDLAVAYPATTHSTRIAVFFLALLWVFFLITVAGLKQDAWYLLGVGSLGTMHNIFVANRKRSPRANGVPLKRSKNLTNTGDNPSGDGQADVQGYACVEIGHPATDPSLSTMDVLKLAEEKYAGLGILLLKIFFPGDVDQDEVEYWKTQRNSLSVRRQGLKVLLDSNTESLAVPPTKRRPPLFSRTSSSISWRGLTGKTSHRQDTDPEKGKTSTKQPAREQVQKNSTDGSISDGTQSSDRVSTHDFGRQSPKVRPETIVQGVQQSPSSLNPRRSADSSALAVTNSHERNDTVKYEEFSSEDKPEDIFLSRPLYPVISEQEPAEGTETAHKGTTEQETTVGARMSSTERVVPSRRQSYTATPNRFPRAARPPALRTQTSHATGGAGPVPGLTRRARTFSFPTNSI